MNDISPLRIRMEREVDGRWLAIVDELPGVMAYGDDAAEARKKVQSIALVILADMNDHGEELPVSLNLFFAA